MYKTSRGPKGRGGALGEIPGLFLCYNVVVSLIMHIMKFLLWLIIMKYFVS